MQTRRNFLAQSTATAVVGFLASSRVLGANNRIRLGLIGGGGRGTEIFKTALAQPNVEAVAIADVYTRQLDAMRAAVPGIATYTDFRRLLDDKSIDAVMIATPQHLHALHFVPAIEAGKDVYQEKTMAFNPDFAKRMRGALANSKQIAQIGMQSCSGPDLAQARALLTGDQMGTISAIHAHMYRNAPYGGWRRTPPADCNPAHIHSWEAFEGDAARHPFSAERFINWRFFWDYSGGNCFENMVHQIGFWTKTLDLGIPETASMSGANYFSPDMQVPDTMDVALKYKNLLFTWNSGFGSSFYGIDEQVLGTRGTVVRTDQAHVSYVPAGRHAAPAASTTAGTADIVGGSNTTNLHVANFLDCVRSRRQPNCPLEIGFRAAVACQMAVASLRQNRTVRWDAAREEIV